MRNSVPDAISVYTDGACSGNPGPGGWGVVIAWTAVDLDELSGYDNATTNNRMELMGAIRALESLPADQKIILHTDSTYVKDGITRWVSGWKQNGWKTAAKTPVKNQDLWERLDTLISGRTIDWQWVKAHNGNKGNERADLLARNAIVQAIMRENL